MPKHRATLLLYSLTIFLSAALLFLVQLIFARMVLPLLGGAPAVWNTAMVFYQAVLLAGYAYAHFLSSRFTIRTQVIVHVVVLVAPVLFLPVAVPAGWLPPADVNPIPWLLGLLATGVALPFFAVSTTSPLLQKWFAATEHPDARDPYFLYAASNTGSLLGLLGYPFLVEPIATLKLQSKGWAVGFGALALLSIICGVLAWRHAAGRSSGQVAKTTAAKANATPLNWPRRLRWVMYAFVPSSLMLSVTTYLSSDIAAVPLLWVLPLAIYLGTFILVFAQRPIIPHAAAQRALPFVLIPVVMAIATGSATPISALIALHLIAFAIAALVCHGEIARDRPGTEHLTEFYLWMSVGGVLGGVFNALIAPAVFNDVVEYHLILAAAAFLGVPRAATPAKKNDRRLDVLLPMGLAVLIAGMFAVLGGRDGNPQPWKVMVVFGIPSVLCFLMSRRRLRFALGLAAVLMLSHTTLGSASRVLWSERSFFGIHRITMGREKKFHRLVHGQTIHGMQSLDPAGRREPLTYYHSSGPLGQVFAAWGAKLSGPIGAVGLGAGAAAAYGKPGQELTFYEIDPVVKRIALDPKYFSYLADSPAKVSVVLGDARLSLQRVPEAHFQLLVLDAYSSDSIPVHLITREAVQLYLHKLAPGGLITFHISNMHMDLRPVVVNLAQDAGLVCLVQEDSENTDAEGAGGKSPSTWAVMARTEADLSPLLQSERWQRGVADPKARLWTDDYSSIVSVLDFGAR